MERTNNAVMDVGIGGASDNDNMKQSIQPHGQIKKINLTEMPREILEHIMIHLDYWNLLTASHVCKLFASIVETAFARKYSNEYYCFNTWETSSAVNTIMMNKYGEKMKKILIVHGDEKLFDLIEKKCSTIEHIELYDVPKIIALKNMKSVGLTYVDNLSREKFIEFINNNQQLEGLKMEYFDFDSLDLLDGRLNKLKFLNWCCHHDLTTDLPKIRLNSLETLKLELEDSSEFYACFIRAMNSNPIKNLQLRFSNCSNESDIIKNHNVIDEICKYKTLASLRMPNYRITLDQMRKLAAHFPDLIEFSAEIAKNEPDPMNVIHEMLSLFPKLTKLTIELEHAHRERLSNELKKSANDFHARFARDNAEIQLDGYPLGLSINKDRLLINQHGSGGFVEAHWIENLNEKDVRKETTSWHYNKELKFVNHCADRAFDITTLGSVYDNVSRIECLDFKSNGPMSVNSLTSRYHVLFPCLKVLKIHLVQHSVVDFLRNLEAIFCEQIEELWLNAKPISDDAITLDIFSKFKNLKSLHLVPSLAKRSVLAKFFSVSQNLKELKLEE